MNDNELSDLDAAKAIATGLAELREVSPTLALTAVSLSAAIVETWPAILDAGEREAKRRLWQEVERARARAREILETIDILEEGQTT